jgi:CheY-like chemotaxis protein
MERLEGWQEAVLRQKERVFQDLGLRQAGVACTCVLFSFFLRAEQVLWVFAACLISEVAQIWLFRLFTRRPLRIVHLAILLNTFLGVTAFCMLAFWLWGLNSTTASIVAVLALVGVLLNAVTVRTADLMHGMAAGTPPAVMLVWLAMRDYARSGNIAATTIATFCVLVLLGYFLSAMIQSHAAERRLADARHAAEEASRAKTRFLSAMSHEMRTPLNTILGISQTLAATPSPDLARRSAADVEDAARRLQMLINDALDLAAAAEAAPEHRPVTSVIRRECEAALTMAAALRRSNAAMGRTVVAEDVPELGRIDPILLRKCLGSLSVAVAGACPDPSLVLSCALDPTKPNRLILRLASEAELDTAVEATFLDVAGSDLAMRLVGKLARTMGGRARLQMGSEGRAEAYLDIPFGPVADPAETAGAGRKVLVVDDISTNRFVIAQLLRTLGAEAVEAESGQDALDLLSERVFDVILLDMNMPVMDGEATFKAIRTSSGAWAEVPVIALTADFLSEQRDRLMELGLDGYVPKPIDRRVLWAEIEAAISRPEPDQFGLSMRRRT